MLTAPFATVRYISSHGKRPPNVPRLVILHTNAGGGSADGEAMYRFMQSQLAAGNTPTQPHHQVDLDGKVWQWLDYNEKGVASVSAEGSCISVETQDYGSRHSPIGSQAWTAEQVESLARICALAADWFGVPLRVADRPDGSGVGWHSMWGINTSTNKPNPWTIALGKTCPGQARIDQVPAVIARAREIVVATPPPGEADDVKPILIQSEAGVWITDWITRRGVAPEDINLLAFLEQVQSATPVAVSETVLARIKDVSPSSGGTFPSVGEIAAAVNAEASRRLAA